MSVEEHRMVEAEYGVVREVEHDAGSSDGSHSRPSRYGIEITVPGVCDKCVSKDTGYGPGSRARASRFALSSA